MDVTRRYPVQYRCQHCGAAGFTRKDGSSNGRGGKTCPTCRFGTLVKMHWTGLRWA
jgi:DNA-directed RNA polymerase subunit RPC12/RpoP